MDHTHKADIPLARHVEVSEALHFLGQQLGCDSWYVACHHERLFVFRLAHGNVDRFAVSVQCSDPIEKGVYHGCKAWALAISPLHQESALGAETIAQLSKGLADLKS